LQETPETVLAKIAEFARLLDSLDAIWSELTDQLSKADLEQQDLLHYLENTRFNASEGYRIAKEIAIVRERRRKVKDFGELIHSFRDTFYCNNKNLPIALFRSLTKLKQLRETQESRVYMPRVRIDL
jgi:hypothetical protein